MLKSSRSPKSGSDRNGLFIERDNKAGDAFILKL